jgi:hypothetical protein
MDRRRVHEEKHVAALDTSCISPRACWYLIDSRWLQRWSSFKGAQGRTPPPGPITNEALLTATGAPRHGLSRGVHYRGINMRVWAYFAGVYGGGPPIRRRTINIYAAPILEDPDLSSDESESSSALDVINQ